MVLRKFFTRIGSRFNKEKGFTPLETRGQSEGKEDSLTGFTLNGAINKQEEVMPYEIKIIRSDNRRKTISVRLVKNTMLVHAPSGISDAELKKIIDKLKRRLHKRKIKNELDKTQGLTVAAGRLNKEYFNSRLEIISIAYSVNQDKIFGSCNYRTKEIRISHQLVQMPCWVRDYVIIHEMAHLIEPNHSNAFWDIVYRYRLTERARGYLMAKGLDSEESNDIE
mgnify:CR=1 FL=1